MRAAHLQNWMHRYVPLFVVEVFLLDKDVKCSSPVTIHDGNEGDYDSGGGGDLTFSHAA